MIPTCARGAGFGLAETSGAANRLRVNADQRLFEADEFTHPAAQCMNEVVQFELIRLRLKAGALLLQAADDPAEMPDHIFVLGGLVGGATRRLE